MEFKKYMPFSSVIRHLLNFKQLQIRKIIIYGLTSLFLSCTSYAKKTNEIVIERIILSNSAEQTPGNTFNPGDSVEIVTDQDKIIFYRSNIAILNPTQKQYSIELKCTDSLNNLIYKGTMKMNLEISHTKEGNIIGRAAQHLGLDPRQGAMIKGQINPLKINNDYYIKLIVEKKLLGLTKFHYATKPMPTNKQ
jgi:hypothetical protein